MVTTYQWHAKGQFCVLETDAKYSKKKYNPHCSGSSPRSRLFTVCAATKTGARKFPNMHTKRQPKLAI